MTLPSPWSIEWLKDWRDSLDKSPSEVPAEALRTLLDSAIRFAALKPELRYLECPCCGDEGAFPMLYEDGQPTICGCGGHVSCGGEGAWINVHDECPRCEP